MIAFINQSVAFKRFEITYDITKRFMSDLLKAKHLPIFDSLFAQLVEDPSRYEAKIQVIKNCLPLMNKQIAARFMKVIEIVLQEPASESIFKHNINPLRIGLMLFKLIDDVQKEHGYSINSTKIMKETLTDQLVKVLDFYKDPDELMILIEQPDLEGNNCFWYLDEYDLYSILDCRIMDRVIQKKWSGIYEVNASILDMSTPHLLFEDKYSIFATDRLFSELKIEMTQVKKEDVTHRYKFHVWQHSM